MSSLATLSIPDIFSALRDVGWVSPGDSDWLMREWQRSSEYSKNPLEFIFRKLRERDSERYKNLSLDQLMQWVAIDCDIEFVSIDPLKVDVARITQYISYAFATKHQILVMDVRIDGVDVYCADPFHQTWLEDLEKAFQRRIYCFLTNPISLRRHIHEFYQVTRTIEAAKKEHNQSITSSFEQWVELGKLSGSDANDQHIVHLVDWLLHYAIEQRVSDIHLEPRREVCRIRFRIDGHLQDIYDLPQSVYLAMVARLKIISRMDVAEKRLPQNGRIKTKNAQGKSLEIRLSTLTTAFGEKIVMRLLNSDILTHSLEDLGFDEKQLAAWQRICSYPNGIVLVTGPTGSGKSSTLYATLRQLAKPHLNICTVEDPIEMMDENFNQVQTQDNIGLNFAAVLRTLMRQDPDVIMIGEIRDRETAEIAIQAALTGHLVFSTLHTNNAVGAITRLLDLGIPAYLLRATLMGVLAQRLLRKLCLQCKSSVKFDPNLWQQFEEKMVQDLAKPDRIYEPKGCQKCRGTGYFGRIGIFELVTLWPTLSEFIQEQTDIARLQSNANNAGAIFLQEAAIQKWFAGETSLNEVYQILSIAD